MLPERILLTGAAGFIGTALTNRLAASASEVHCVFHRRPGLNRKVSWHQSDLTENGTALRLVETLKPDLIINVAGLADGRRDQALVPPLFFANAVTTMRLLDAAATVGCGRFVHCASLEEPETSREPVPTSPYAAAKWVSSTYVRMYGALYGLPTVMLRVFYTYGPGVQAVQRVIPYTITELLRGNRPKLSSGKRKLDWIYIDDVVDAFMAACVEEAVVGQLIDVGSGVGIPVRKVVEELASIINSRVEPAFGEVPDRVREITRVADTRRAYEMLGWRPKTDLRKGLAATIAWYRQ